MRCTKVSRSKRIVTNHAREYWHGRESLEDDRWDDASPIVINIQPADPCRRSFYEDRRVSVAMVAELVDISSTYARRIINEHLNVNEIRMKSVPRI